VRAAALHQVTASVQEQRLVSTPIRRLSPRQHMLAVARRLDAAQRRALVLHRAADDSGGAWIIPVRRIARKGASSNDHDRRASPSNARSRGTHAPRDRQPYSSILETVGSERFLDRLRQLMSRHRQRQAKPGGTLLKPREVTVE